MENESLAKLEAPAKNLGPELARYRGRGLREPRQKTVLLMLVGTVVGLFAYGIWRGYYGYTRFGSAAARAWSEPWLLAAGLGAGALLPWLIRRVRIGQRYLVVGQNGLALGKGRRSELLLWRELSGISVQSVRRHFWGRTLSHRRTLTLYPNVGPIRKVDHQIEDLASLIDQIKQLFYPERLAQLKEIWRSGARLYFGAVSISPVDFRTQDRKITWDRIREITIVDGYLVVSTFDRKKVRIPVWKIQNPELLLKLIDLGVAS